MDNTEAIRQYKAAKDRQYHQRPDVKERRRQRESDPATRERIRAYNKEYQRLLREKKKQMKTQGCLAE